MFPHLRDDELDGVRQVGVELAQKGARVLESVPGALYELRYKNRDFRVTIGRDPQFGHFRYEIDEANTAGLFAWRRMRDLGAVGRCASVADALREAGASINIYVDKVGR